METNLVCSWFSYVLHQKSTFVDCSTEFPWIAALQEILTHLIGILVGLLQVQQQSLLLDYVLLHLELMVEVVQIWVVKLIVCIHFFMYWSFFKILEKGRFGSYSFFSMWCGRVEDKLRANKHEGVISQTMWWFNHHQLLLFIPQESDLSQCRNNYILWSSISFGLMISHFVLWVWNKVTKLFFSMRHTKEKNMRSLVKGEMIEN